MNWPALGVVWLISLSALGGGCSQSTPESLDAASDAAESAEDRAAFRSQTAACLDDRPTAFRDYTVESRLRHIHGFPADVTFHERSTGGGAVLEDLDGDGDLDLALTDGRGQNQLFLNDGAGRFGAARDHGLAYPGDFTVGLSAADYDNDGDTDLLLLNRGPDRLLQNDGAGTFSDVTPGSGLTASRASASASWGDLDGDGRLDLFIAVLVKAYSLNSAGMIYDEPLLYRNLGQGRFEDVSAELGNGGLPAGSSFIGPMIDLDADGDLDLFVTQEFGSVHLKNLLYRNDGRRRDGGWLQWTEMTETAHVEIPRSAMGVALLDVDSNGLIDLHVTNLYGSKPSREVLLQNEGAMVFTDVGEALGAFAMTKDPELRHPRSVSWASIALDIENDGDDDLYLAYGHFEPTPDYNINPGAYPPFLDGQANALLLNQDGRGFTDVADACVADSAQSRGAVAGDLNADGCIDLVLINQTTPARVFLNNCATQNHALELRLIGRASNRDAIGAQVRVDTARRRQMKHVHGCSTSVHSCEPKRLHFGLGAAEIAQVSIKWPSGQEQTLSLSPGAHDLVEP